MIKQIISLRAALIFFFILSLFCPCVFAQGHDEGLGSKKVIISRDSGSHRRNDGERNGHGSRHYYNNGKWYRHGWFGWGVPVPVLPSGVIVDSLPSAYTMVVIHGNAYYYGDNTYFKQLPAGGFTVVTGPLNN